MPVGFDIDLGPISPWLPGRIQRWGFPICPVDQCGHTYVHICGASYIVLVNHNLKVVWFYLKCCVFSHFHSYDVYSTTSRGDISFCDVVFFSDIFNNHDSMNNTGKFTSVCILIFWTDWGGASSGYYVVWFSSALDTRMSVPSCISISIFLSVGKDYW